MKDHDLLSNSQSQPADKLSYWARTRRGMFLTVGGGCFILGAVLVGTLVRPETLQSMSTLELCAIVGFVVMPALTLLSIRHDRKVVKLLASRYYRSIDESQADITDQHVRVAHQAHARAGRLVHHPRAASSSEKESHETLGSV